jgi:hypothetical protein
MGKLLPLVPVLAALVAGCGGGGGSPTNPFAGSYAGSGTVTGSADKIETYAGVGNDSSLCGALKDTVLNTRSTYGGTVSQDGLISNGTIQAYDSAGKSTGTGTLTGVIKTISQTKAGNVTVSVSLDAVIGSTKLTYAFSGLQGETAAAIRVKKKQKKKG